MTDRAQVILQVLEMKPCTAWEASVASVVRDLVGTIEGLEARLAAEEELSGRLADTAIKALSVGRNGALLRACQSLHRAWRKSETREKFRKRGDGLADAMVGALNTQAAKLSAAQAEVEDLKARLAAEEAASKSLGLQESYAEIASFIAQRTRRHCPSCASSTDSGDLCDAGENQTVDAPCMKWSGR